MKCALEQIDKMLVFFLLLSFWSPIRPIAKPHDTKVLAIKVFTVVLFTCRQSSTRLSKIQTFSLRPDRQYQYTRQCPSPKNGDVLACIFIDRTTRCI